MYVFVTWHTYIRSNLYPEISSISSTVSADDYCVKSVRIWSFSGPYFSAFGLNAEIYSLFSLNAGKYGREIAQKLRIRTLFTHWLRQLQSEDSLLYPCMIQQLHTVVFKKRSFFYRFAFKRIWLWSGNFILISYGLFSVVIRSIFNWVKKQSSRKLQASGLQLY